MSADGLVGDLRAVVGRAGLLVGTDAEPHLGDWRGVYRGAAVAVVRPGSTGEVAAAIALAADHGAVVVPQGGNTGLSGGATPPGERRGGGDDRPAIVLSTSRLAGVERVDTEGWAMTVRAGTTIQVMQEAAAAAGRLFGPDWGARGTATIGGAIATNAGGINVVRYGTMRDQILGLEVVLADGRIWDGLRALRKDSTGFDLKHLFIGSEGTLGVVTRAVVRLSAPARHAGTALAALPDLDRLLPLFDVVRTSASDALTAFELMPRSAVDRVCTLHGVAHPFRSGAGVGTGGEPEAGQHLALLKLMSERPVIDRLAELLARASEQDLISDAVLATTPSQQEKLWFIRHHLSAAMLYPLHRHGLKLDTAVPIGAMARFHRMVHAIAGELVPDAVVYGFGHVGDGNLHLYILPADESAIDGFRSVRAELSDRLDLATFELGGTLSAEHGVGQELRSRIGRQKPPVEWELMWAIKDRFDPENRMNPGKLLPPRY